jgi:hypothetical protein
MIRISPIEIVKGIILLMAIASIFLFMKWREAIDREKAVIEYAKSKDKEIEYYRNSLDEQVAKTDAVLLETKSLRKLAEDNHLAWLHEFDCIKKNLRNVEVATKLQTETIAYLAGSLNDTTIVIDGAPTPAFTFDNSNEWISETGTVIPSLKRVETIVKATVPVEVVTNWERKSILGLRIGRKQYKVQVKSKNPFTTITGADQILIR